MLIIMINACIIIKSHLNILDLLLNKLFYVLIMKFYEKIIILTNFHYLYN